MVILENNTKNLQNSCTKQEIGIGIGFSQKAFNEQKFYDEETGKYINLQALRKKYKHIANELLYDKLCMSEIECAVNEAQCQKALINARERYWGNS